MTDVLPAVMVMGAVFILGVGRGLWLAWTHEARMWRWAGKANAYQRRLYEAEERGQA